MSAAEERAAQMEKDMARLIKAVQVLLDEQEKRTAGVVLCQEALRVIERRIT